MKPVLAAAALALALVAGLASSAAAGPGAVRCQRDGERLVCPRGRLEGPRGPRGPVGEPGPQGPVGVVDPAPWAEQRIRFVAAPGTGATTVATFPGGDLAASCDAGGSLSGSVVAGSSTGGPIQVTNTATRTRVADRQFDDGESLDLLPGPVPGTDGASYALVAFGPNGIFAQDTTGQFAAFDGGGYPGGAACLLYGTLKVA